MVDETRPDRPVVPHRLPLTRRQILTQIVVALVILGSGIAIGIGGTILSLKDRIARFPLSPRGDRFRAPDPNGPIEQWRAELNLTDEQAQRIKDLLSTGMTAARERWIALAKEEQQKREEFVASMKSILTPEQFVKWQDEFKERERHFQRWRPGGPGGPDDRRGGPDGWRGRGPRGMRGPEFGPDHPPGQEGPGGPGPDRPDGPMMDHPPEPGPDGPREPGPVDK